MAIGLPRLTSIHVSSFHTPQGETPRGRYLSRTSQGAPLAGAAQVRRDMHCCTRGITSHAEVRAPRVWTRAMRAARRRRSGERRERIPLGPARGAGVDGCVMRVWAPRRGRASLCLAARDGEAASWRRARRRGFRRERRREGRREVGVGGRTAPDLAGVVVLLVVVVVVATNQWGQPQRKTVAR